MEDSFAWENHLKEGMQIVLTFKRLYHEIVVEVIFSYFKGQDQTN